jgi:hypothetical protein
LWSKHGRITGSSKFLHTVHRVAVRISCKKDTISFQHAL